MTKEQEKETIKYLEFLQKEYLEDAKRKKENGEITGYGTMEDIDKLRALHIGFALDMLKEKDAKIEHLEEKRNNQKAELAILNEKQKEMNKLTNTVSSYKGMFKKEQKDNKKKDKIIYEMMGSFLDIGFGFEYCNNDNRCINDCEECLMKYFERKATNNG